MQCRRSIDPSGDLAVDLIVDPPIDLAVDLSVDLGVDFLSHDIHKNTQFLLMTVYFCCHQMTYTVLGDICVFHVSPNDIHSSW